MGRDRDKYKFSDKRVFLNLVLRQGKDKHGKHCTFVYGFVLDTPPLDESGGGDIRLVAEAFLGDAFSRDSKETETQSPEDTLEQGLGPFTLLD